MLQYHFTWKVVSAAAGITWWNFYFRLYRRTIRGAEVIDFLGHLLRHLPGRLLIVWDGLPAHRGHPVKEFIAAQRGRLAVEQLPAYAPELNPAEQVFGNLKSGELANLCRKTILEIQTIAEDGLDRIGTDAELCFAFLRHAGLHL